MPNVNAGIDQSVCTGTAVTLSGSGATSYTWDNGVTNGTPFTPLATTTYTVTGTDVNGCQNTDQVLVTVNALPTVNAGIDQSVCTGTAVTLSGSGATSYTWNNGVTNGTPFTPLATTTYTVTGTDVNGCQNTDQVLVTVNALPTPSITGSTTFCTGGSTTLDAGSYTSYLWSNSALTQTINVTTAGTYAITVTNANGCTGTDTVNVTENSVLSPTITGSLTFCTGGSTTLDAGSYTSYLWSNSALTQTINVTTAGTYAVTVTDANGCIGSDTVNVLSDNPITINITATQTGCSINNGTATANVSGGTPGYTYNWSNSQLTQTATGLGAETYIVTVTDAVNCTQTQTVTVTSNNTVTLTTSSTQTGCTTNNGTSTVLATGGITPYTYLWDNGQTTQTATGLDAGAYSVTVTDANGCTQTQTENVTQTPAPIAAVYALPTTIMQGDSSILTATGGITYQWSPGTGLSCYTCTNPIATPMQTTIYCVFVTDSNGCTDSTCIEITVETPCGEIFVPNAFSPNDDGSNELECVMGNCIQTFHFVIYDRWGEKVFETSDINRCWDGTYKGKLMNTAVFVYFIKATLTTGEKVTKKGNISLVR